MEFIVQLHDILYFLAGVIVGYFIKTYMTRNASTDAEQTLFAVIVLISWLYANIYLQVGDWWLNVFMGLVMVQLFDASKLKGLWERK